MASCRVSRVDSPVADPTGFAGLMDVLRDISAERDPDDPPITDRELRAELAPPAPDRTVLAYLATVDGEPAGLGWAMTISAAADELQVAHVDVNVRRSFRRRGIANAVLAELIPELAGLGQVSLLGEVTERLTTEAAAALCTRYGLTRRGVDRCSRAPVGDIDEELLSGWIDDAARHAPGYRLEQWEGPCPPHLAEAWAAAMAAMEDEPLDDYDYNPYTRSAEVQATIDAARAEQGFRVHRTLALSPDGEAAGLSALSVHEDRPQIGHQGDTGVLAAHRGHRLGRWMKAANYHRVRQCHPEMTTIQTYNAESNPWMLAINVAMGFRPHRAWTGYQGSLATAAAIAAGHR